MSLENQSEDTLDIRVGRMGTYIDGLSEWPMRCYEEGVSLLDRGSANRLVAPNHINERSSRSHLIVLVKISRTKMSTGQTISGYLYLTDLAGSERIKLSAASGSRLREAQNINK